MDSVRGMASIPIDTIIDIDLDLIERGVIAFVLSVKLNANCFYADMH